MPTPIQFFSVELAIFFSAADSSSKTIVFVRYSFIYQVLQQFVIIPQYSQGNCAEA
jgi:hypothetical protein